MKFQKNKYRYYIMFTLLLAFLFLPMIQEHFKTFKVKPLNGVNYKTEVPEFTLTSFSEGKFQAQLEDYISENFGFREFVIRLYNQYVWTFFNKTYNKSFVRGEENWFYYFEAVREYKGNEYKGSFKSKDEAIERYEENIRMMCQLREILKEYGIEFMTFMAPDKPFIYPEYLPDRDSISEPLRAFEYYDRRLTEIGFPNIEMTKWFKTMRDTASHPVMHTVDSHWGVGAAYGCDSLFKYLDSLNDFGMPKISYGDAIDIGKEPTHDESVLNLLFPIRKKNSNYRLDIKVECDENTRKPRVLFVGDSFIWSITKQMPLKEILSDMEIWYYNSTVHKGFKLESTKKENIDPLLNILKNDYVVFYSCGHQWHKATYNFLEETLAELGVKDSTTNHDREKVRRKLLQIDIENDSVWNNTLKTYAFTNNISLEEVYMTEVDNIVNNDTLIRDSFLINEKTLFDFEVHELIKKWRNNPEMMKYLEDKAAKKNKPLEEVILGDAKWVIKQNKK
ncbi:MAG: hypothetical protein II981_09915 [Bacteroidales bacterium]|nr:hypothetical protein [Bacteroidales bacterium]